MPTIHHIPEGPRDSKLDINGDGRIHAPCQLLGELPQADDEERYDELVAEEANP